MSVSLKVIKSNNIAQLLVNNLYREKPYNDMNEMMKEDSLFSQFGMVLVNYGPGWSKVSMAVHKDMLNGYGATHGAVIYALSDVAFAIACNSRGTKGVALSMNIHYRRPAGLGETLTAEGREESLGRTTGVYRMKVTNGDGKLVAVADGLAFLSQK